MRTREERNTVAAWPEILKTPQPAGGARDRVRPGTPGLPASPLPFART